jgi:hypothetical protein
MPRVAKNQRWPHVTINIEGLKRREQTKEPLKKLPLAILLKYPVVLERATVPEVLRSFSRCIFSARNFSAKGKLTLTYTSEFRAHFFKQL